MLHEFAMADLTGGQLNAIVKKLGGHDGAMRFLRDELAVVEVAPDLVYVDRSMRPTYPDWMREVMHPELEVIGPVSFDAGKLEQWLHHDQKTGVVRGQVIYDHLKSNDMLPSCLGLRDLEEVQKKGIKFFRKHFQGRAVFGWKSVVRDESGDLDVPYLIGNDGEVVLDWSWLDFDWGSTSPALRFANLFISLQIYYLESFVLIFDRAIHLVVCLL